MAGLAGKVYCGAMTTAAGIIIGDEILSGKVRDENAPLLVEMLREAGVRLRRLVVIRDDMDEIVREVRRCSAEHDYVFTSGGVGPTHDDLTMAALARAFDLPLEHHPVIDAMVRQHWGDRVNDAVLKLADLPRGARLIQSKDCMLPLVSLGNIFILPGIPRIFRLEINALRAVLEGEVRTLSYILINADETAVAALLTQVVQEHPAVKIGSYPQLEDPECTLRVTVEGVESRLVEAAVARLRELLPHGCIVRVEQGARRPE